MPQKKKSQLTKEQRHRYICKILHSTPELYFWSDSWVPEECLSKWQTLQGCQRAELGMRPWLGLLPLATNPPALTPDPAACELNSFLSSLLSLRLLLF